MSHHNSEKGGSVALLILVMAAFLGILYIGQIEVAKSSIEVNKQKQLLDMAGTLLGNNMIKSGIASITVQMERSRMKPMHHWN